MSDIPTNVDELRPDIKSEHITADVSTFTELEVPEEKLANVTIIVDKGKQLALEGMAEQIIVKQDKFKTGFECKECDGEGYLEQRCGFCEGKGRENLGTENETFCRMCCPRDMDSMYWQAGKLLCYVCKGRGATVIIPQNAQRKATSGIVVSCGAAVKALKVGERVLYSVFAGTEIEFKNRTILRIMHEHEIMCRLWGVAQLGDVTK